MKKNLYKIIILILASGIIAELNAQSSSVFQTKYGGVNMEQSSAIVQTLDQGYVMAGTTTTYGSGNKDILLIKTNKFGTEQWTRAIGSVYDEEASDIAKTSDDGFIVVGYTYNSSSYSHKDIYMVKTNHLGNVLWQKTIGMKGFDDEALAVIETADGGYLLTGYTRSIISNLNERVVLIKTSQTGTLLWNKIYDHQNNEDDVRGLDLIENVNGNIVLTGAYKENRTKNHSFVMQTKNDGTLLWFNKLKIAETIYSNLNAIDEVRDGGALHSYVLGGWIQESNKDVMLVSVNPAGGVNWINTMQTPKEDEATVVKAVSPKKCIVGGNTQTFGNGSQEAFVLTADYTNAGFITYLNTVGQTLSDAANDLVLTYDGGIAMAGYTYNYDTTPADADFYLIKMTNALYAYCHQNDYTPVNKQQIKYGWVKTGIKEYTDNAIIDGNLLVENVSLAEQLICTCNPPQLSAISYEKMGLTVVSAPITLSSDDTVLWGFGDGNVVYNIANPTYTYQAEGTYSLCYSITNQCGITSNCVNITVYNDNCACGIEPEYE